MVKISNVYCWRLCLTEKCRVLVEAGLEIGQLQARVYRHPPRTLDLWGRAAGRHGIGGHLGCAQLEDPYLAAAKGKCKCQCSSPPKTSQDNNGAKFRPIAQRLLLIDIDVAKSNGTVKGWAPRKPRDLTARDLTSRLGRLMLPTSCQSRCKGTLGRPCE